MGTKDHQGDIKLWTEFEGIHRGRLVVDMPWDWNYKLTELPGAKPNNKTGRFTLPRTWNTLQTLRELAAEVHWKLQPDDDIREWGSQQGRAWGELSRAAKVVRTGDKTDEGYYLHQVDGANWLLTSPDANTGRLLQDETGAGKTVTVIKAIVQGKIPGPILIVCLESAIETAWVRDFGIWAPDLRVVPILGTIVKRRKLLAELADGKHDVAIIGHSNLKAHTRFEAYGSAGLKKCVKCGGPRLTSGKTDDKGKPLPDIDYHVEAKAVELNGTKYVAQCLRESCDWAGTIHSGAEGYSNAEAEAAAHRLTGKKVAEVSEAACQRHMKELNQLDLQLIVVDEIHRAMNAHSQFTQAIWGVANWGPNGGRVPNHRRWGLTGTPVSGHADQAWPTLHWINPEGYPSKGDWVPYFCKEEIGWDGRPRVDRFKEERIPEFQRVYSACTRRVLKEQVLNLPPFLRWGSLERRVEMGTRQRVQYTEMRDQMRLAVESGLITAQNAASAAGRLSMLASGCGKPDPNNRPGGPQKMLMDLPSCKLDAIIDDFRSGDLDGHSIGMTFASAQVLYMIRRGLIEHKILTPGEISVIAGQMPKDEVDRAIKAFQSGKTRVVMLTYAKGGASITLNKASMVLCVQRSWSPIDNKQGLDRFYRIGSEQHESVTVLDYVTKGTNEVPQLKRLDEKAETLEQIVQDRRRLTETWFA